jgi:hypothetical protein
VDDQRVWKRNTEQHKVDKNLLFMKKRCRPTFKGDASLLHLDKTTLSKAGMAISTRM